MPNTTTGSLTSASVGTSAASVLAPNVNRQSIELIAHPDNTARVFFNLWGTATTSSIPLDPGASFSVDVAPIPSGAVSAIAASGTQVLFVIEG